MIHTLIQVVLFHQPVFSQIFTMIRGKNNNGLFQQVCFPQPIQYLPHIIIYTFHSAQILGLEPSEMILPFKKPCGEIMTASPFVLFRPVRKLLFIKGFRDFHLQRIKHGIVRLPHPEGLMGIRHAHHEQERPAVFLLLYKTERFICQPVCGIGMLIPHLTGQNKLPVLFLHRFAMPEFHPVIPAVKPQAAAVLQAVPQLPVIPQMPFSRITGHISGLPESLCKAVLL